MTKKTNEKTKEDEFRDWVDDMVHQLHGHFLLDMMYYRVTPKFYEANEILKNDGKVFSINTDTIYKKSDIIIYPEAWKYYKAGQLNFLIDCLIHELTHIHTAKLTKLATERYVSDDQIIDATEELTEIMAQYIRNSFKNDKNNKIYEN